MQMVPHGFNHSNKYSILINEKGQLRLEKKRAIITGAGTGIGRAIAERFSQEGAKVMVAEIEEPGGNQTVERILKSGGTAVFQQTDTSLEDSIQSMVERTVSEFGGIDIVVNNAAAFVFGSIEETGPEEWGKVLSVNVIGYANTIKSALSFLKKSKNAAIVNIASVSSFIAQPEFLPYNTSKGAISQMTRCLAMDLAKYNIRVNAVCPGAIYTRASEKHMDFMGLDHEKGRELFGQDAPLKRMGRPDEIANGVLFLASEEASFITGEHLVIDGGATLD